MTAHSQTHDAKGTAKRQLLDALERGESLPSEWYTSNDILSLENASIFRRFPQYVGHVSQLRAPGDFITATIGGVPVVVVRSDAQQTRDLKGFVNVCRHRRHEVMSGCGNAKTMQCPYHAWTYDLNGQLVAAPRSDREPDFNVEDYPLLPVKIDVLGPWVFASVDSAADSPASMFASAIDLIKSSGIAVDTLELYRREEWHANANWKTMLENYLECYHCPVAHPGFSALINVDPDDYVLTHHQWCLGQVGEARETPRRTSKDPLYDAAGGVRQAQYHLLWPNCTISINPGFPNLSVEVWMPDGPNRTRGISENYFAPGVDKEWAEELIAFNHRVGREDDVLTDSVQRGAEAGLPRTGRLLLESEKLIVEFQKLLVKTVL